MAVLRVSVAVIALLALGTLFLAPAPAQAVLPDSTLTKWVFLTQQVRWPTARDGRMHGSAAHW